MFHAVIDLAAAILSISERRPAPHNISQSRYLPLPISRRSCSATRSCAARGVTLISTGNQACRQYWPRDHGICKSRARRTALELPAIVRDRLARCTRVTPGAVGGMTLEGVGARALVLPSRADLSPDRRGWARGAVDGAPMRPIALAPCLRWPATSIACPPPRPTGTPAESGVSKTCPRPRGRPCRLCSRPMRPCGGGAAASQDRALAVISGLRLAPPTTLGNGPQAASSSGSSSSALRPSTPARSARRLALSGDASSVALSRALVHNLRSGGSGGPPGGFRRAFERRACRERSCG